MLTPPAESGKRNTVGTATKVMYLADHIAGPQAGTEGQLLRLVGHLDRSRYDPAMAVLRHSEFVTRRDLGFPVTVLDIAKLSSVRSIFKFARFALALRRQNYRLVHCFLNDVSLLAPPWLWMCGIRVVVSRRDMGIWYTPLRVAVLRLVSRFVDCYTANCHAVAKVVQERERVAGNKISVIRNGFAQLDGRAPGQTSKIEIPGVPEDAPVVGIVANLRPIKRIDDLIHAFASVLIRCPEAWLVVVGADGPSTKGGLRREFEALAQQLGIAHRLVFTGRVDDSAAYIARFTVAVLCSETEGLSNSVLEYMRAGCPTICTNTGGNPELIQDRINGLLVPVGDVKGLADRLILLLTDRALARSLGKAARDTVSSTYSVSRMAQEQMACYDHVLQEQPGSSAPAKEGAGPPC